MARLEGKTPITETRKVEMMTNKCVGLIGGGRIARILLEGWQRAKVLPAKILVSDCNTEALTKLQARGPTIEIAPVIARRQRRQKSYSRRCIRPSWRKRLTASRAV